VYDDAELRCQLCEERGWECHKVAGPKTAMRNATIAAALTSMSNPPSYMSLVRDVNLTDTENFYLGWYYQRCYQDGGPREEKFERIMLQHIWSALGITADPSLMYAILCAASYRYRRMMAGYYARDDKRLIDPHFLDRFLVNFQSAIRKGEIKECHLYAAGLIAIIFQKDPDSLTCYGEQNFNIHFKGFLAVRMHLLGQLAKRRNSQRTEFSLSYLHPFLLNVFVRYLLSRIPYRAANDSTLLAADAILELERIEISTHRVFDTRLINYIPTNFLSSVGLDRSIRWNNILGFLYWNFRGRFWMVGQLYSNLTVNSKAIDILLATESGLEKILRLPLLREFLEFVTDLILTPMSD
jgi:hypothetical protein